MQGARSCPGMDRWTPGSAGVSHAVCSRPAIVHAGEILDLGPSPRNPYIHRTKLGRVDEFMEFWTIVLCRCSSENIHGPPLPRGQACAYSSAMLCGRQSNPCSGNSSTPPAARRGSATGCSSKLSCTKPAPGPLGGTCPTSSATGTASIIAFAVGKRVAYGSGSGIDSSTSTMTRSASCSSIRPLCVHISTPPERQKKRWATSPGSGPPFATTGGFSTKLHAACTDERTGVSFVLTGGQRNDAVGFESVWEGVPALPGLGAVVMDKAYDSNTIRQFLAMQGIEAVIAPKANRIGSIHHDAQKYQLREKVERFFNKLKQFRRGLPQNLWVESRE